MAGVRGTSFLLRVNAAETGVAVLTGKVALQSSDQELVVEELKENSFVQSDKGVQAGKKRMIRGGSLQDIKDAVKVTAVEKTGELDLMRKNLKKLMLIDQRSADDELNLDLQHKMEEAGKDSVAKTKQEKAEEKENYKVKDKKLSDDEEYMLDK